MGYQGRRCSCGMVYTHPQPAPGSIDCTIDHHPVEFYAGSAAFKARWVAARCPPGRLLEVGCGEGFFLMEARARGYDVVGLDAHLGRARHVSETLQIEVESCRLEDSRLPPASFDVVYHCDLLAHFSDPIAALHLMARLLRPDGVLCFEVGILGGISPIWYRFTGGLGLGYHLWLYSGKAVYALLAQAGLHLEHVQRFGLAPRAVVGTVVTRLGRRAARRSDSPSPLVAPRRRIGQWVSTFLRYRVGSVTPRIGPETWLIVARPISRSST